MNTTTGDTNFDKFRRERRQRRAQFGNLPATAAKTTGVRDIEAYEARQMHETKLTRDVHDFLAEATKHAAAIVEKVTQVAEAETAQRLAREMHEFLEETLRRAARFMELVHSQRSGAALQDLEPHVSNLVGPALDEFRFEGTAQLADKHIGQDPFVDAPSSEPDDAAASSDEDRGDAEPCADGREARPESAAPPPAVAAATTQPAPAAGPAPAAPALTEVFGTELTARMCRDPETLKNALKALVKSGVLSPDDAREAYRTALQKAT